MKTLEISKVLTTLGITHQQEYILSVPATGDEISGSGQKAFERFSKFPGLQQECQPPPST